MKVHIAHKQGARRLWGFSGLAYPTTDNSSLLLGQGLDSFFSGRRGAAYWPAAGCKGAVSKYAAVMHNGQSDSKSGSAQAPFLWPP